MQDTNGGSSAMNMLSHALRGVKTGAASAILVWRRATGLALRQGRRHFNVATREHLAPLGHGGPTGSTPGGAPADEEIRLGESDYGHLAVAQRAWAAHKPIRRLPYADDDGGIPRGAHGRRPAVALRLRAGRRRRAGDHRPRIPIAARADARRCARGRSAPASIRNQEGDGLRTGISTFAGELWQKRRCSSG